MKIETTFVTVADFLENKGELKKGRSIYSNTDGNSYIGEFQGFNDFNMPMVGLYRQTMSIQALCVKVKLKIIYK